MEDYIKEKLDSFYDRRRGKLLYCLQLLLYVRDVVNSASSTISDALYFKLSTVDLKRIFSANFLSEAPIEQLPLITLGAFWLFIIAVILRYNTISKMQKKNRYCLKWE